MTKAKELAMKLKMAYLTTHLDLGLEILKLMEEVLSEPEPLKGVEYQIVRASGASTLEYRVQESIKEGWKPYGPPCMSSIIRENANDLFFGCQAMIKEAS